MGRKETNVISTYLNGQSRILASEEDLQTILNWNRNAENISHNLCIHQLFEQQAKKIPEAIAVRFGDQSLTYGQLEEKSNKLANYLIGCGVKPDTFVGICIERSLDMIVGIYGILKAGGAYVPLDTEYPEERLAYMVENSGALAIVTTTRMLERLPRDVVNTICIDEQWHAIDKQSSLPPDSGVHAGNLIYVIYTSGSTGKPKGTLVYHGSFVNLLHWYTREFDFGPGASVLLMTSTSFDLTQKNIFAPLVCGGRLVVLETDIFDASIIKDTIERENVTSINCTPSAFHGLLQDADEHSFVKLASLKQVFLGGEPVIVSKLRKWRANPCCKAQIVNSYGPTECTDVCSFYRLVDYHRYERTSVPIGRPICNTELFIVDEDMRLLPIGEEGELCIGGAGVGAGYLNRDDLTAEKFISDPFGGDPSRRLYRTGDLVRYRDDGNIEYIGRIDQQVKIRGFRIELGEIEALLEKHESVREAVVDARETSGGVKQLVAYIVRQSDEMPAINVLRSYLQRMLPDYMLPTAWMFIEAIPLTPNRKIDRNALPAPDKTRPEITQRYIAPKNSIEVCFAGIWREILGFDKIGVHDPFFEMGGTSIQAIQFIARVGQILKTTIPIVHFFDAPTISRFIESLERNYKSSLVAAFPLENAAASDFPNEVSDSPDIKEVSKNSCQRQTQEQVQDGIAIIGLAGKFPGANNKEELWENIMNRVQASSSVTREDLETAGLDPGLLDNPNYIGVCYPLDGYDRFDAAFFGYTPKEAELLDPQQRFFLERAWEVLEDAGYDLQKCNAKVGIFGGVARNGYLVHNIASHKKLRDESGEYQSLMGNEKDFPVTRAAYKLGLTGPAVNVQTACSSSGVALHLACQSLRSGDCDMAIVGGCRVMVPHRAGYMYVEGSAFSADGSIRAFDSNATGMVRGSGGGCILVKRLQHAIEDGDHIYAVIKGSAVNNDGSDKMGFTAPSIQGQAEVIAKALAIAGVEPETIKYVEAHGTGTNLGDPIEFAALTQAYGNFTDKKGFCSIGSVKANIGHLDAGACVTGIIKTALAIKNKLNPPQINFDHPNPAIPFEGSPFFVNTAPSRWVNNGAPIRAGVSSFGLGGSNAHIILEEAPKNEPSVSIAPTHLFKLSARTREGLDAYKSKWVSFLKSNQNINLGDLCHTLQVGRRDFEYRYVTTCRNVDELTAQLENQPGFSPEDPGKREMIPELIFMFPGQGSQHINMGRELYEHEALFRYFVDQCSQKLMPQLGCDLRDIIYPDSGDNDASTGNLTETRVAQPALFVMEYSMAMLLRSWGIKPDYMIGHSIGEITAACLAGVFSLDDALSVVALRGRLMQDMPKGEMLSVSMSEEALNALGLDGVCVAAVNTKDRCVVSGSIERISSFMQKLDQMNIPFKKLVISHAFHSQMMDPVLNPFAQYLKTIQLNKVQIPVFSCKTGKKLTDEQATDPFYWADQLRQPVRFAEGLSEILQEKNVVLLEVGPGNVLRTFAQKVRYDKKFQNIISTWGHSGTEHSALDTTLTALGKLWIENIDIDWARFTGNGIKKRIPLPTYPFEGKKYWIDPFIEKDKPNPVCKGVPSIMKTTNSNIAVNAVSDGETVDAPDMPEQTHRNEIKNELRNLITEYTGFEEGELDDAASFLELGLDSIYLTQLAGGLKKKFHIDIKLRRLFEDLTSIDQLAEFLSRKILPPSRKNNSDILPGKIVNPGENLDTGRYQNDDSTTESVLVGDNNSTSDHGNLRDVVFSQLKIMEKQLELLGKRNRVGTVGPDAVKYEGNTLNDSSFVPSATPEEPAVSNKPFGAVVRINKSTSDGFTEKQKTFFENFSGQYLSKTKGSKTYTETHRSHLADPRVVSGFSPPLKELVFPIVVDRSAGSRVWDIDGNEYIDMTNGFGANLLGHAIPFIQEAIASQLKKGIEIGPQHPLAGEVAQLICEMTGLDRAIFCNTGSEAVMGAMRISRSVTGRDKIVIFSDDYHGMFDEVIVRGSRNLRSIPAASGIPFSSVENIIVLEYGSKRAIEVITEEAGSIAAVLVEPVQSRNLDLQPKEFLRTLRHVTEQHQITLIFDEVVTGFRSHMGGAQAYFGISADIATYGKVVGGGMPIGVIAGRSKYMDALDGGIWRYGDASIPEAGVTYFAGTFVRHPLALAAAKATLNYLKECGPGLQEKLNARTLACVTRLRDFIQSVGAPIKILHFSSAFQFQFTTEVDHGALIYPILRSKGIHIFEGRTWFFTTAHTDEDVSAVCEAFQDSVRNMIAGGFISGIIPSLEAERSTREVDPLMVQSHPPVPGARLGKCPDGNPAWFVPDPGREGKFLKVG